MTLLQASDLPQLSWLELDLTLIAHAPPRQAHPLVVLEALFKGVFEGAGLDPRQVKQLWHSPGKTVHTLAWQAGSRIPLTLQLFGLEARHTPAWHDQLQARFAPASRQNFSLIEVSPWRIGQAPKALDEASALSLDFLTPVPLPHAPGRPNTALDPTGFIRLCQTRLRKLFGHEGALPPAPLVDTSAWRYWRKQHRSRSQSGHPMFINGCVGPLHLAGEHLPAWLAWLALFSAVGLGERLTFGQGRFRPTTPPATDPVADTPATLQLRRPFVLDHEQQGSSLSLSNANLIVRHEDTPDLKLPLMRVAHVEIHSPCQLSSPLLEACAREGIPVLIASPGQTPLIIAGRTTEAQRNKNIAAHHAAWAALNDTSRARLAARLVDEKLAACAWLIRQRYQAGDHQLIAQIERARQALGHTERLTVIRGWEGWAARHYHRWLQQHMQALGDFQCRQHHGQIQNPVNSLLNYGYGLLRHRLACEIRLAGLDPWLGILHEANGRHEALVSDFMEPWRPHIDRLVVRWIRLRMIQPDSFSAEDGQARLIPKARARVVQDFTRALEQAPRSGGPRLITRIRQMTTSYATAAKKGELADWHLPETATETVQADEPQPDAPDEEGLRPS